MLEALEAKKKKRKELQKLKEELRINEISLFKSAILLLIKNGVSSMREIAVRAHADLYVSSYGTKLIAPCLEYNGEISENGVSAPVCLYSRHNFSREKVVLENKAGLINQLEILLEGNSQPGNSHFVQEGSLIDIVIEMGDEKDMVLVDRQGVVIFGERTATPDHINFLQELNTWIERQIGN